MSASFLAELEALGAVYGEDKVSYNRDLRRLVVELPKGNGSSLFIKVDIPVDYPEISAPKPFDQGEATEIIASIFQPGQEVLLQFIEMLREGLQVQTIEKPRSPIKCSDLDARPTDVLVPTEKELDPHVFIAGEPIVVSKSRFVSHAAKCTSPEEARSLLLQVKQSKYSRATHNMWAYRLGDGRADNEDDGETAAGGRLAELLHVMSAKDVFVVVTRFYGGVQLGSQRFKIISQSARSALDALKMNS